MRCHSWFFLLLNAIFLLKTSAMPLYADEKKDQENFRNYTETTLERVKNFYRLNHTFQTLDFVLQKKAEYFPLRKEKMSIWEAIEQLDTLVDESDPDLLDLPQCYHFYQTAEALRKDGHPRWLILTGFIHDLGKMLAIYGEPQWATVGDTFPVGCLFSEKVVFPEYYADNPDSNNPIYQTKYGIYSPGCGFDNLHMSWGHDEYLYQIVKDYLPEEAAYIIRYHSFYAAHRKGAYEYFVNEKDKRLLPLVRLFSQYDLYSKTEKKLNLDELKPYYQELVDEFFPPLLDW